MRTMHADMLENVPFDALEVGSSAQMSRVLTRRDIELLAAASGDAGPEAADEDAGAHEFSWQSVWPIGLVSTLICTRLPGPGTECLEERLCFGRPAMLGDSVSVTVTVAEKRAEDHRVVLDCLCCNAAGETLLSGQWTVRAPTESLRLRQQDLPRIDIRPRDHFEDAMARCRAFGRLPTAVVHPVDAKVIEAVADAVEEGLIEPVLIGPAERIRAAIAESRIDAPDWRIVDVEHSHAAAARAAELAACGEVQALMKGALHTDELLAAVVPKAAGLRTERRISHVYLINVPTYHKPLMITDAAINIAPDLAEKADICQNAIELWRVLFPDAERKPKVALLSAVETVTARMPSTVDAAALCKMADRGQIVGGELDGPLAFDNAINAEAVRDKHIVSDVAGDADILVVPNIEAGNALAKQLIFFGDADAAGIVLGARVPIILTSRADSLRTRLLSCGVAMALAAARRDGRIK